MRLAGPGPGVRAGCDAQAMIPALVTPMWHARPSGLVVPSESARDTSPPPSDAPVIARHETGPVLVMRSIPSAIDQVFTFVDETLLGLPVSSADDVAGMVRALGFERAILAIARLGAHVDAIDDDHDAQVALADLVFSEPWLVARIRPLLADPSVRLFAEQPLFALTRMLVLHADDRPLQDDPAPGESLALERAILGATALTQAAATDIEGDTVEDWLPFLTQNAAFNRSEPPLEALGRTLRLFVELPELDGLRDHRDQVSIDDWMREDHGLGLVGQLVAGLTVLFGTGVLDRDADLVGRSTLGDTWLAETAASIGCEPARLATLMTAGRDWYRQRFAEHDSTTRAAWDRVPFEQRPLLALDGGALLLVSPRAIWSWVTDGLHFRALDAARRRSELPRYTRYMGALVERHVLEVLSDAHPAPRPPGGGVVHAEQRYGRGGGKRTPDVAIDLGEDLVLVEVVSGRFTVGTRVLGDPEAVRRDLEKLVLKKVRQLSLRVDDLLDGSARIPGVDPALVRRIWPVLVTHGAPGESEALWDHIDRHAGGALHQARVRPLTLMGLSDVELLAGLVHSGRSVAQVLDMKTEGPYGRIEFRRFARDDPRLDHHHRHPAVESAWERVCQLVADAYGLDVDVRAHRRGAAR